MFGEAEEAVVELLHSVHERTCDRTQCMVNFGDSHKIAVSVGDGNHRVRGRGA